MISISTTTELREEVERIINSHDRLDELVEVGSEGFVPSPGTRLITIDEAGMINPELDWMDTEPPYVFPPSELSREHLLSLVFYYLGNFEQALEYAKGSERLEEHLYNASVFASGGALADVSNETALNKALLTQYVEGLAEGPEDCFLAYGDASIPKECSFKEFAFAQKHKINLLIDMGKYREAKDIANDYRTHKDLSDIARLSFQQLWCTARSNALSLPYDSEELLELHTQQKEVLKSLADQDHLQLNHTLFALEASDVAMHLGEFAESLALLNQVIRYAKEIDELGLLGEAGMKKGHLLYNWSKNGSPQYYKAAINAFQDVLKVFRRDTDPARFAEVQHILALIYTEMPDTLEDKAIWTAFAASAFKEARDIYQEHDQAYEYAMVCHNYATAILGFPPAKLHDNRTKAAELFNEALQVRTAEDFPMERALTLLNQLELDWHLHNADESSEEQRLQQMEQKIEEVERLTTDSHVRAKALGHLERIDELKAYIKQ